jgi:glutathione S-transferase
MWKFYYAPISCSLASHIALEQAGAKYEAVRVDFTSNAQRSADYLKVNPKGRVPALVTEHGVLTETLAILTFVAQKFPDAGLAPFEDAWAFARMQSFNSYLASTVHVAHAHRMRGKRWVDDPDAIVKMQEKVARNVTECFDLIEHELFGSPWVLGERYSVSDPYLFTISRWLESDGVDPSRFPKVLDHRERMAELPAAKKVIAEVENWN